MIILGDLKACNTVLVEMKHAALLPRRNTMVWRGSKRGTSYKPRPRGLNESPGYSAYARKDGLKLPRPGEVYIESALQAVRRIMCILQRRRGPNTNGEKYLRSLTHAHLLGCVHNTFYRSELTTDVVPKGTSVNNDRRRH